MMLVSFAILSIAGVVFLRQLVPTIESRLCIVTFGPVLGLVFGRFCLVLTGLTFGPSFVSAAVAHGLLACMSLLLTAFRPRRLPSWSPEDRRELDWILSMSSAVLLAMAFSYWGVGRLTAKGYAYVPHFGWDFFNHVACSAELSRQIPPQNPYFAGQPLHYYWSYHLWPAAIINLAGVTAREALELTLPPTALLFVGALTGLVYSYEPKLRPRYLAIGLGLFAYSYLGALYVARNLASHLFRSLSNYVNIDYSFMSHSWFRDFLYEPHAATALSLLAFLIYLTNRVAGGPGVSVLSGLVLGTIAITDILVGMIAFAWFGTWSLWPFLKRSESRSHIVLAALVSLAVILSAFGLHVFPARSGALRLGLHPAAKYGPIYLLIELGPLSIFGAVGLYGCRRRGLDASMRSMLLLLVLALLLAFTLIIDIEPNHVIRKSIKVVELALVVFATVACSLYLDLPSPTGCG